MRPRFQADADFNQKIVLGVRRREPGVDFEDAHAAGVTGLPDPDVLKKAADLGGILISHDRKTMPAHYARFLSSRPGPGLIIVPQDLDTGLAIEDLLIIWAASEQPAAAGSIELPTGTLVAPCARHRKGDTIRAYRRKEPQI